MVARLVLGVVLTAAVLTACGTGSGGQPSHPASTAASSSPSASNSPLVSSSASATSPPASTVAGATACAQQYHAWQNGPAHAAIIKFGAAQQVLATDSSSGKPALIAAALNIFGQAAAALERFPVPPCADPHGYFATLLSQVVTAADEVASRDATLADLQQAINQLGPVFSLESDFTAEVKQTTGS